MVARFVADYAGSDAGDAGAEVISEEEDASTVQDAEVPAGNQGE
jgi:hypothetical protein